jgi:WD40 repeat protein
MRICGSQAIFALIVLTLVAPTSADEQPRERDIVRQGQPWLRINAGGHLGTVRALAFTPDSKRLCSAGTDKTVQVWNLSALRPGVEFRDINRSLLRERSIRWQVARGPRGNIFALATAPEDSLLAMAGYGAMGSTGEILLVDPIDGSLKKVVEGHRQTVCTLAFSSNGLYLLSVDTDGESRLWRRGDWTSTVLYQNDRKTYGDDRAKLVQGQPLLRPAVFLDSGEIVLPVLVSGPKASPQWQLQRISVDDLKQFHTWGTQHVGIVTALAATPGGKRMASADLSGALYLWDLTGGGEPRRLAPGGIVRSLAFSPDGQTLVVGTAASGPGGKSELQVWNVRGERPLSRRVLSDHVHACAISPDGSRVAYVGGNRGEVFVDSLAPDAPVRPDPAITLRGTGRPILKVAFAKDAALYRVAFGVEPANRGFNDYAGLQETFDPSTGLGRGAPLQPADWQDAEFGAGRWRVKLLPGGASLQLFEADAPRGIVELDKEMQGQARCYCWVPGADGKPLAIAVGTDTQNGVYVFRLAAAGRCPLVRQFRGHQDFVTSVAISRDFRYLASGSADGTVQYWSLADLSEGQTTWGRWGVRFEVVEGGLRAQDLNEAGPVFRRGLRAGDQITRIRWVESTGVREAEDPLGIARWLEACPWDTQIEFSFSRRGADRPGFQLLPAWQTVASLFVSDRRQWAFWTPEGYYDASDNGHTMFGWQINRGLRELPLFYRADQFRRTLERPDLMEQLLPAGSLENAFRLVKQAEPADASRVLPEQIAAAPLVEILSPRPGELVAADVAKIRASVRLPADGKVVQARVFANGVVAHERRTVDQRLDEQTSQRETIYEWTVAMPREEDELIQVFVGTEAQTSSFERVAIKRSLPAAVPQVERPRLFLLAVGVNDYQDTQIPALDYPVADAEAVVKALESEAPGLYRIMKPIVLENEAVNRRNWAESFAALSRELKQTARPDDLLVIFMAGHGEIDEQTQTYHFICHDAQLDHLLDGSGTISWNDFALLADIPCRKLAMLDTCHSGAIQGVRQDQKLAIRQFQEHVVFTLAAAADNEGSQEKRSWSHGAFTKGLLDGLAGAADRSGDSVVTLEELVTYLSATVPKMTDDMQHPIAAPDELLQFVTLPLAKLDAAPPAKAAALPANPR